MDPDLTRLPTGNAGWCGLVDHAVALGDLAEVDYLELKGTLSFAASDRKRSAVVIARALLGMANRMPDVAERHLGGYGVVLVGVYDAQVVGAEQVDGAALHDSLEPYVGDDGPRWDYVYVNHSDGLVLAVVVEVPRWGDRTHACRKSYSSQDKNDNLTVNDGDVFVRLPGKTRRATSADLADLERRRDRSPTAGARIVVEYTDAFDRIDSESARALVMKIVDETADELLEGVPSSGSARSVLPAFQGISSWTEEQRSPEKFVESVESWRSKAEEKAEDVVTEFLRHGLARGRWAIRSESLTYLEGVRVQIDVPPGVRALMASDTEYCDHGGSFDFLSLMPQPPSRWGTQTRMGLLAPRTSYFPTTPNISLPGTDVELDVETGASRVTWNVGDLRPGSREVGSQAFAIVTDRHVNDVEVTWRVWARGLNHVFEGSVVLRCQQPEFEHLQWTATR